MSLLHAEAVQQIQNSHNKAVVNEIDFRLYANPNVAQNVLEELAEERDIAVMGMAAANWSHYTEINDGTIDQLQDNDAEAAYLHAASAYAVSHVVAMPAEVPCAA